MRALRLRQVRALMWRELRKHIQTCAWHILRRRASGKPIQVLNRKEALEILQLTQVDWQRKNLHVYLQDVDRDLVSKIRSDVHKVLVMYKDEIRSIFRFYSTEHKGQSNGIDTHEFKAFLTDTQVVEEGVLSKRRYTKFILAAFC